MKMVPKMQLIHPERLLYQFHPFVYRKMPGLGVAGTFPGYQIFLIFLLALALDQTLVAEGQCIWNSRMLTLKMSPTFC